MTTAKRSTRPPIVTARDPSRRRRILDTAKRHFTQFGFKGTSLDAVAADAGCSKGALYLEFVNKEALLREVVQETLAAVSRRYADEILSLSSPLSRLTETLRFAYREIAREPMMMKLLREDPDLRALHLEEDAASAQAAAAQIAMLRGWVDEGIAAGEIRQDVDRDAIPFVLGTLRFLPQHLGLICSVGRFSGERVLDAVVDIFAAGLAARPASVPPTKAKQYPQAAQEGAARTKARPSTPKSDRRKHERHGD